MADLTRQISEHRGLTLGGRQHGGDSAQQRPEREREGLTEDSAESPGGTLKDAFNKHTSKGHRFGKQTASNDGGDRNKDKGNYKRKDFLRRDGKGGVGDGKFLSPNGWIIGSESAGVADERRRDGAGSGDSEDGGDLEHVSFEVSLKYISISCTRLLYRPSRRCRR